ncbi:DNA-binding protein [Candidatus Pacearchaeota archaeon]|nr:DNA-binding protein [Candidatus Pacearchaeota archaeon]
MNLKELYEKNIEILNQLNIKFKECDHEPVLSYETAKSIRKRFNLTGIESKNLFLKSKDSKYYLLLTIEGKKANFDLLKSILGKRVSLASPEELKEKTGCIPGCATPFGNDEDIDIIFDQEVLKHDKWIYSPGVPEKSIEIETKDLPKILSSMKNKIIEI